ncbi:MAG: cupredoxin domain-containing protein [Nitrososphaeraceae archaeon]
MTTEDENHIIRTTPRRLGKGLAIVVGLIIVGAAINLTYWDQMDDVPPPSSKIKAEVAVIPPSPVFDMASDTDEDSSITFSDEKPTGSEEKPKADVTLIILEGSATQGNPDYDPKELTVKQGQTILADNVDVVPHTVTSGTGPSDATSGQIFDTGIIMAGESAVMDTSGIEPGTYDYYCTVHPYMVGKLTIE